MIAALLQNLFWLINALVTAWVMLTLLGLLMSGRGGNRQ